MEKLDKIFAKIALKIDGWIALKSTKFVPKLRARCMVVVNKHKNDQIKFGKDYFT